MVCEKKELGKINCKFVKTEFDDLYVIDSQLLSWDMCAISPLQTWFRILLIEFWLQLEIE